MENFRADLHCHSTCSDGTLTPKEIIQLAAEKGLKGLSITDHDTVDAYPDAFEMAASYGVKLIAGVEFSASLSDVSVHILGYGFDLKNTALQGLCRWHAQRRKARNRAIIDKLVGAGYDLCESDLGEGGAIGRPHIALALMKKGYVKSVKEAFHKLIGDGKPYFVHGERIGVAETLRVIHDAKGVAVIAHPHLIRYKKVWKRLLGMDFEGIEAYYSLMSRDQVTPWIERAEARGWFVTGGSDFHGDVKPDIPLGVSWTPEAVFNALYERQHYRAPHVANGEKGDSL